jgi:phage FluMu protein Com
MDPKESNGKMKFYLCSECGARLFPESPRCTHCGHPADYPEETDLRCECGFLLCKLTPEFLEIKCRRCKRIVALPIMELPDRFHENQEREANARRPMPAGKRPAAGAPRGQYCTVCGRFKPNVLYGKCLDCRTETIKVQYRGRAR